MQSKFLLLLSFNLFAFTFNSFAQLSGIKTIPGDYATIVNAVSALNAAGVGAGGVTFNVAAGHTESITIPILLTATGTASNPIIFQKSGGGVNPKVTRTDAGTVATSILGGQGDAVIIFQGSDYVTFDAIDAVASNQGIEYGYYLRKASSTDGCKNLTIKNCFVDLTKGTSQYVTGIYSSNNDAASLPSSATGITVTSEGGRNENVTIKGNTVQDVFVGILLRGYNHTTSPYNFYDQNFVVGENGSGNTIQNFAGNSVNNAYGVYLIYHNNANISYNTINNTAGGGSDFISTGYGIFHSDATNGSGTYSYNIINLSSNAGQLRGITSGTSGVATLIANNNIISLSQAGTEEASCIYFQSVSSGSTITINNNTLNYGTFASTTTSYLIYSDNAASNVTVSGNQTGLINKTGAGEFRCISITGSPTGGSALIQNNNMTNVTLTGASTFYGIYHVTNTSQPKTISGNTVSNITGGANSVYGIFTNYDGTGTQIYSNVVTNISGTGATVYGYKIGGAFSAAFEFYSNEASNISCSGTGAVYGIQHQASSTSSYNSYSNNIFNLSGSNSSSVVYGLYIQSGTIPTSTVNIYNNFISELKAPLASSASAQAIYGIYINGTNTVRVFFNTIYLNSTSSGTNFGSNGIYWTTTSQVDLRNNIVINVSTPNGTGRTVAFRANTNSLINYSTNSNNNCFYAGTPGANNLIFFNGTNGDQTITQFKTRVGPTSDAASFTEDVPFVNKTTTPYDLHVNTTIATLTESGGIPVSSPITITTDFDGDTRNATTPDVGADEFNGTSADTTSPAISYTLIERSGANATKNFSGVTITDQRGVNTTPGTAPRVYFKKSTDPNDLTGWKWVEATGTGPFSFLINYLLLNAGSVSVGDIVQYFVVAQDLSPQTNVGINSGTFNTKPSSVNLVSANFPIGATINSYTIVESLSGTILVGSGQSFTTLSDNNSQGLFRYINERVIVGDLSVRITSNLPETGIIALNQTVDEGNHYITIQPNDASEKQIFRNTSGDLIKLNGADRIIFDGRFGGSGNYLSFVIESTSGQIAPIRLISQGVNAGAKDVTIRNCNIRTGYNGSLLGSYGIYVGGFNIGNPGEDNDNLTITENVIKKVAHGINIISSASGVNNNITITNNTLGSTSASEYIGQYGVNVTYSNSVNISGNIVFNIISNWNNISGITLSTGVVNGVISGNKIYSLGYTGTSGWGGIGIGIATQTTNANILVRNNLIYDMWGDGWDYTSFFDKNPFGIYLNGNQSGVMIYNNSINLFGNTLNNSNAISAGIGLNTGSSADIKNNIIVNNLGLLSSSGYGSVGIFLKSGSSQLSASSNNLFYVNPSGSGAKVIGQISLTGYSTIQSWRTATGKDKYSYNGNPAFISNTNLLPDNTNPNCWSVNNKGIPLSSVSTDFNGNPRSTTVANGPVDIGAYEFTTTTTPPAAVQGGSLGNNQTTTYSVYEYQSGSISWGSSGTVPSSVNYIYYTGEDPATTNTNSKCYWEVTQSGGSGYSYDITFNYDESQLGAINNEADIRLVKSDDNGLSWTPFFVSGTGTNQYLLNTTDNTIKVHGLNSFSLFALTDVDDALPIELNSFRADVEGRDVVLNWETKTEVNAYGFEVERKDKEEGSEWEKINSIAASGNSNSPKQYSYTDKNLNSGRYKYRLKMIDNDGTFSYSNEVESEVDVPNEYLLSQNYPNPFNPVTKIDYQLPFESNVRIELYNITGERVEVLVSKEQASGYYSLEINSSLLQLTSGIYIYRMTAEGIKEKRSYIQTKKMVLLK